MLVLSRKAAEGVRIEVEGKVLCVFYVAPLGRAAGIGIRGVYMGPNGLKTFEQSIEDGPALLPGLPNDCETTVQLVEYSHRLTFKARIGIIAPDHVEIVRDELADVVDDEDDDNAKAA